MSSKANSHNIPLNCSLCPKNPHFSDVSHLLTHISSKSHLANKFKLQIRANSELAAKVQLDLFSQWYNHNGIDDLLSERLTAKEQKQAAKEKKARASNVPVKKEKGLVHNEDPEHNIAPMFRAPVPQMHLWSTTTVTSTQGNEWDHQGVYSTPTTRRQIPNFYQADSPAAKNSVRSKLATPLKTDATDNDNPGSRSTDSAKLKGTILPGMDLFDSATPEMKRRRNQRKDGSILEQMIATSAVIEPLEYSYHPDGQFRYARDIFGPPSAENSPVAPSPKKRKPRSTKVLGNMSVNAPRLRASRTRQKNGSPQKRADMTRSLRPANQLPLGPPPTLNPLTMGFRYAPSTEETEEFRMAVINMDKKRGFDVFRDAPEISPGRTESPPDEHRYDFAFDGLTAFPNTTASANIISPTPLVKPTATRGFGKENGHAESQGRRTFSAPAGNVFPSQVFHDPTFNPLYSHAHARSFGYGEQYPNFGQFSYDQKQEPAQPSSLQGNLKPASSNTRAGNYGQYTNPNKNMHHGIDLSSL